MQCEYPTADSLAIYTLLSGVRGIPEAVEPEGIKVRDGAHRRGTPPRAGPLKMLGGQYFPTTLTPLTGAVVT